MLFLKSFPHPALPGLYIIATINVIIDIYIIQKEQPMYGNICKYFKGNTRGQFHATRQRHSL